MPQSSFASLRNRFGISTKLQVAFCAAGAMSLLAGVVAIGSFSASETEFHRVTGTQVPLMVEALQLSASVGEVSAEAARFISAANTEDQRRIAALINRKSADLTSVLERLRAEYRADETLAHVQEVSRQLGDNLQLLETTITQRSQLRAKLNTGLSELYKVRLQIHDQLVPVIDDAYFDAVTAAENLARGSETERTVEARIWGLRNALEIETQAQVATGFRVAPFLGRLRGPPPVWRRQETEIAEILEVPLSTLANPALHAQEVWELPEWPGGRHVAFYRIGPHKLWGVTYRIVQPLLPRLLAGEWDV